MAKQPGISNCGAGHLASIRANSAESDYSCRCFSIADSIFASWLLIS